ncbi:type II secretion system protein F [bacterium BMS3Abin15]|nr:type II secretion system protein F [bacterium BMS3Abin15]HDZ85334.1 type II secretion system F family protein [Candidatus Moranbacteria bacterium]
MKFVFKAKDQEGAIKEGKIEAGNRDKAVQLLQKENLIPMFVVREKGTSEIIKEIQRVWEGATQKELMVFFRELATLIGAKVPVVPSLRAIQEQAGSKYLKIVIKEIADDVEDGMPLSESMARYPNTFNHLVISMIKAGEVSGNLQRSILFVADNIGKNYRLASKVRSALFYPAFVIIISVIIGFVAATIILPKLTVMIEELEVAMPWYTQVIIFFSKFMENYWWAVLIVLLGAIGGFIYYIKTEAGRREWDKVQLNIPVVGKLFRYIYITRFASNFSVLLAGGIPIVRALTVVSEVVGNSVYQSVILRSADEVKTGGNISTVFSRSSVIPPIVSRIIKIGEETGKTSEVTKNIADFYEEEADVIARNLSAAIEPILIIFLGMGVAILVFAILLPIYDIAGKL